MGPNRKELKPVDRLVAELLKEQVDARKIPLRTLADYTGMSLNRLGKVFRFETPPITIGEIVVLADVFGMTGSEVMAQAEARMADLDTTMFALAARAENDDDEAAAQQIDP